MKIKKLLMPLATATSAVAVVAPMVGCSNLKTLDLANIDTAYGKWFGITGNFEQGTNYEFVADLSKWDEEHGKAPSTWDETKAIVLFITNKTNLPEIDLTKTKVYCDGTEAKQITVAELEAGQSGWTYEMSTQAGDPHVIYVAKSLLTKKYNSKIVFSNIAFKQKFENGFIVVEDTVS